MWKYFLQILYHSLISSTSSFMQIVRDFVGFDETYNESNMLTMEFNANSKQLNEFHQIPKARKKRRIK